MKIPRRRLLEIFGAASLGAVPSGSMAGCSKAEAKGRLSMMGVLKSAELITADTVAAIYGRHKVDATRELIRHDIEVYRITYTTRDTDGSEVIASGAILVPKAAGRLRMMCYCRGTIIPVHGEKNAPSYYMREKIKDVYDDHYEMSFLAATFASSGYLVVAPDAIGYGATRDREHPYMHAASLAWTSLDMLKAAREFARQKQLDLDPRVLITGWSEGGLCGMALHKLIEDTCRDEFPVAASSLFAGTYAIASQFDLFCNYDEGFPEHHIYYWKLRSMIRVYRLKRPFDKTVVPPFAAALTRDVIADAPNNPRVGLESDFLTDFLENPENEMRRALRDNNRYDWKPLAPVFLHHGTHDDIVPFFCAQMAYEAMRARGARVKLYPYLGKDHYEPVNTYVTRSLDDFAKIR